MASRALRYCAFLMSLLWWHNCYVVMTAVLISQTGNYANPMLEEIVMFVYLAVLLPSSLTGQSGAPIPSSENPQVPMDRRPDSAQKSRWRPGLPIYATTEGQPIDGRPPEKSDDKPLFPEQTRAPFHATRALHDHPRLSAPCTRRGLWHSFPTEKFLSPKNCRARCGSSTSKASCPPLSPGFPPCPRRLSSAFLMWPSIPTSPPTAASSSLFSSGSITTIAILTLPGRGSMKLRGALTDVHVIFRTTPAIPSRGSLSAATKTGGRLAIGRDGICSC